MTTRPFYKILIIAAIIIVAHKFLSMKPLFANTCPFTLKDMQIEYGSYKIPSDEIRADKYNLKYDKKAGTIRTQKMKVSKQGFSFIAKASTR